MNANEIKNWLKKHDVTEYKIYQNSGEPIAVDILESIDISYTNLNEFPFKIYHVQGNFKAIGNNLKSLFNAPTEVYGNFLVGNNQLTSLEYGPQLVRGNYNCSNNKITSLKYLPKEFRSFKCFYNPLTSIKDFKSHVLRELELDMRQIDLKQVLKLNVDDDLSMQMLLSGEQIKEIKSVYLSMFDSQLDRETLKFSEEKQIGILFLSFNKIKVLIEKLQLEKNINHELITENKKIKL